MRKQLLRAAMVAYLALLGVIVWRADVKYGANGGAKAALVGLILLVVLWRVWRAFSYILFGGRVPMTAVGQSAQFQPLSSRKAPPRP
jgi:hypothetical protein